jgi:hypothetical protein
VSAAPRRRRATVRGSADSSSALTRAIVPGAVDRSTSGEHYSSHDEFIER